MILLIFGLALTLLSLIVSLIDKWKAKNIVEHKKKNFLTSLGFLIGIIGMSMSFYSGKQSLEDKAKSDSVNVLKDKENKVISQKLISSENKIIALQNKEIDTTGQILSKSIQLEQVQKKLIELQLETNKQLTGNNLIPEVTYINHGNNVVSFTICDNGNYSIPDVSISFVDSYEIEKKYGTINLENVPDILNFGKYYNMGSLNQKTCTTFYTVNIPNEWKEISYLIYVYYLSGGGYLWHVKYSRNQKNELKIVNSEYAYLHSNKKVIFPKIK